MIGADLKAQHPWRILDWRQFGIAGRAGRRGDGERFRLPLQTSGLVPAKRVPRPSRLNSGTPIYATRALMERRMAGAAMPRCAAAQPTPLRSTTRTK
jgi:hypothetical protein